MPPRQRWILDRPNGNIRKYKGCIKWNLICQQNINQNKADLSTVILRKVDLKTKKKIHSIYALNKQKISKCMKKKMVKWHA